MLYTYLDSPIGKLVLAGDEAGLQRIALPREGGQAILPEWRQAGEAFAEARRQLTAYFAGELTVFDLPLVPQVTPFQARVLEVLREVPYGETVSYGELAQRIGNPNASRAVGMANGRNPLAIVIPCHRVIGANGALTGYGGGLAIKRYLLALEQRQGRLV